MLTNIFISIRYYLTNKVALNNNTDFMNVKVAIKFFFKSNMNTIHTTPAPTMYLQKSKKNRSKKTNKHEIKKLKLYEEEETVFPFLLAYAGLTCAMI